MALSKYELEEVVEELQQHKGRHTELITVYIPEDYDVNSVQKQLEAEKSTAKNIKSTATRKNVIEALEKIVRELKALKKTPKNGLGIFCGNVSKVEGQNDLQFWAIEPPIPLKMRLYRCDKEFVLEPLEQMLEVDEVYGLLVMDRKEATIGMLEGKRIEFIQNMTSGIPSKVRAGGQCLSKKTNVYLDKDELETRESGNKYLSEVKIGDKIKAYDIKNNKIVFTKVKNKWDVKKEKYLEIVIDNCWKILASEDHTFFVDFKGKKLEIKEVLANDLKKGDFLIESHSGYKKYLDGTEIKDIKTINKEIELIDIETEEGNFFAEGVLVHNSSQRFHRITEGLTKEFYKRVAEEMKKNFFELPKLKGLIVGGPIPTKDEFLDGDYLTTQLKEKVIGRVDMGDTSESGLYELVERSQEILVNQEITKERNLLDKFFQTLGENPELAVYDEEALRKALEFGAVDTLIISKETDKKLAKELKKAAENISSKIEFVSTETDEGKQFLNMTKKGIGAILRYKFQ